MEESVWLYVGILAALIGIATVVSLFTHQNQEQHGVQLANTVQMYKELCTQVCRLPEDTRLSAKSPLPAGAKLYTTDESVCASMGDKLFCGRCPCTVEPGVALDLSQNSTLQYFRNHDFTCSFIRSATNVTMRCSG
jgi:hypothetical protein